MPHSYIIWLKSSLPGNMRRRWGTEHSCMFPFWGYRDSSPLRTALKHQESSLLHEVARCPPGYAKMRLPQIPRYRNESSSASSWQLGVNKTVCRSVSLKSFVWSMARVEMGVFTDPLCQFVYRTRMDRDAKELSQKGNFIQWILPHLCIFFFHLCILTAQTYPWYC